ncbi:metal ABC transporter solute-binding protein, Zn/Mn family [Thermodesulfobacteriota bacterium]
MNAQGTRRFHVMLRLMCEKRLKAQARSASLMFLVTVLAAVGVPVASSAEPLCAFVSILPQRYFVERIGGDLVDVSVMVLPGANPATYEPKPKQMASLGKARVYFAIGVPFEEVWLNKIAGANPGMMLVRTDEGIRKIPMAGFRNLVIGVPQGEDAGHYPGKSRGRTQEEGLRGGGSESEKAHHHGVFDPHTWLSPLLAKIQARHIRDALCQVDPDHRRNYEKNHEAFAREIEALDKLIRTLFAGKEGTRFMVFHPAWGYFAHAYGLSQVPVQIEGKEPKPAQLQALISYARRSGIRAVFVQPQFSTKSAESIARAIGGQVVFADPLAEDWAGNLRKQAQQFRAALR